MSEETTQESPVEGESTKNQEVESETTEQEVENEELESETSKESEETENSEEDSEEEGEESEEETTEEKIQRLIKLKINGQEQEFNLEDAKELEKLQQLAQLGGGARAKMQEAAQIRKAQDEIENLLKNNPEEILRKYGHDPEALAEEIIERQIMEAQKSPEQLEREKLNKELEEARQELKRREEETKVAKMQQMQEKAAVELDDNISKALDNYKTLPKSPYVVKRIAEGMLWALENNYNDVKVDDIVPIVHNEIQGEIHELLDSMPEEVMEEFIGKRALDKLRKKRLEKHSKGTITKKTKVEETGKSTQSENKKANKKITMREFLSGSMAGN